MTSVVTEGAAVLSTGAAEDDSAGGTTAEDDGAGPVGAGRDKDADDSISSTGFFQWARAPVARAATATAENRIVTDVIYMTGKRKTVRSVGRESVCVIRKE